jgi:hypothetical protein
MDEIISVRLLFFFFFFEGRGQKLYARGITFLNTGLTIFNAYYTCMVFYY